MSFRNLTPGYHSAIDAGQNGFHIMQIGLSFATTTTDRHGYDDPDEEDGASNAEFEYVEYIAGGECKPGEYRGPIALQSNGVMFNKGLAVFPTTAGPGSGDIRDRQHYSFNTTSGSNAQNTTFQYHIRRFPNVKYWSSIQNFSNDFIGIGFIHAEVNARSLVGDNWGVDGIYEPTGTGPTGNVYMDIFPEDTIYGKFDRVAMWEPSNSTFSKILKLNVGEYKKEEYSE